MTPDPLLEAACKLLHARDTIHVDYCGPYPLFDRVFDGWELSDGVAVDTDSMDIAYLVDHALALEAARVAHLKTHGHNPRRVVLQQGAVGVYCNCGE